MSSSVEQLVTSLWLERRYVHEGDMFFLCHELLPMDEAWHSAVNRYHDFLEKAGGKKIVLLKLGVGFNTSAIIRFSFERMVSEWKNTSFVRINKDDVQSMFASKRIIAIKDDISAVLNAIICGDITISNLFQLMRELVNDFLCLHRESHYLLFCQLVNTMTG